MKPPRRQRRSDARPGPGRPVPGRPAPERPAPTPGVEPAAELPLAPMLGVALVLITTRAFSYNHIPGAFEDAYITFRYALHWSEGLGPVFNAGEKVWGFSSMLWTSLLALIARVGLPLPEVSRFLGIAADLVSLVVGMRLLAGFSRVGAWAYGVFFSLHPYVAAMAVSGMEVSLFWCLMLCAASTLRGPAVASGLLIGALALVRPEGSAAALLMMIWARWPARLIALGVAAVPWVAFALYYGQWIPQSVVAKALTYATVGPTGGRHWYDWFIPFQFAKWPDTAEGTNMMPLAVLLLPGLIAAIPVLWRARASGLTALAIAGFGILLGYTLVGASYFNWYLLVPLLTVVSVAAVGLDRMRLPILVWAAVALFLSGSWTMLPKLYRGRAVIEQRLFKTAGDMVRVDAASLPRDSTRKAPLVFLEPIGWMGWQSGMRVADEVGLVTPWIARRRRQGPGWYADFVEREKPQYIFPRASMLTSGQAFAGAGSPFRSEAEKTGMLSHYTRFFPPAGESVSPNDIVGLRRNP